MDTQFFSDPEILLALFNIIIADILLSGDNAVVIGMAARNLPKDQQKKAILFGAGVAVLLRASLTIIATFLLGVPLLKAVGGVLLLWIAMKLLLEDEGETNAHISGGTNMKSAIKTIVIADVVMSLDNVLAVAGAAKGHMGLVLFGLALSIPIIMWGSRLVSFIMTKFPWLVYVGSGILGYIGGQLLAEDPMVFKSVLQSEEVYTTVIPIVTAILVLGAGFIIKWNQSRHKTV
ncbi:TerC family protein [Hazenella coriacea]|uniref:YjbE family integral membrane protein n=1 Tax=Hazenella coriacea TaxID=1179467 RepID=A0A4R3L713_9BACL|nr:TerC family protein [Hazenella coriacea]TCS94710.1 YjbE family integral membrane protein [Hazenella coriacea]